MSSHDMTLDALFVPDGDRFVPTQWTRGPWSPHSLHGGPPSALLARGFERHPGIIGGHLSRITIELLKPVPLEPLRVEVRTARGGKRVELLEASLSAPDGVVARASAWRIAPVTAAVGAVPLPNPTVLGDPETATPMPFDEIGYGSFGTAIEARVLTTGQGDAPGRALGNGGPRTVWFRLRLPLVAAEETSPTCLAVALADFGNGISSAIDFARFVFINPDLTVYLHRLPVGEWVALDAATWMTAGQGAMAESALHDTTGRVGRSVQTLLVSER
jgi:hypothetical protein